jgi:UDP-N-acetylglucosamine 2-epimerase (non-hydrolysing)
MKILVVMGTRPEAIKLAPVVAALRRRKGLKTFVCATAQHRELLDQVLRLFALKPDFDLDLMRPGQTPDAVARRVLAKLSPLLARLKPDLVVVQGDTTTAAAAALGAFERSIPVAHVEAGLRSYDANDPFPEERNRVAIDTIASLVFPPTAGARANLVREKLGGRLSIMTGNTVVDALRGARPGKTPNGPPEVLVTLHRREIHGAPLRRTCAGLLALVEKYPGLRLVCPVHPNPAVRREMKRLVHPRIRLIAPLAYPELLALLKRAPFVITDSGGVLEEAVSLGKPVLIVRAKTERPEAVARGAAVVVGRDPAKLGLWAGKLLKSPGLRRRMSRARNAYGDGRAAERVAAGIAHWFGLAPKPKDWRP